MDKGGYATIAEQKVKRFNGSFFKSASVLDLSREEIGELYQAARANWKEVDPAIFGTLLEQALDKAERAKLGAHYHDWSRSNAPHHHPHQFPPWTLSGRVRPRVRRSTDRVWPRPIIGLSWTHLGTCFSILAMTSRAGAQSVVMPGQGRPRLAAIT